MMRVKRNNMAIRFILCVGLAMLLSSCATTRYTVSPDQARPAFSGKVLVFEKTVPENIKYSVIGDFVSQSEWYGGTGETENSAVKEAAAKGANGLLVVAQGHRMTAFSYASPYTEGKLLWVDNYDMARDQQAKK